jgi:hypothetical protein
MNQPTPEQLAQLKTLFDRGLTRGVGDKQGQTCIEGAISLVFDGTLGDTPTCVHEVDRQWAIEINDAIWSSPQARAEALFPIALAQIGTADKDRSKWAERVVLGTIQRVLPIALEVSGLESEAKACREATDLKSARVAATAATAAATAACAAHCAAACAAARAACFGATYNSAHNAAHFAACAAARAARAAHAAHAAHSRYAAAHAADEVLLVAVSFALAAYAAESPNTPQETQKAPHEAEQEDK